MPKMLDSVGGMVADMMSGVKDEMRSITEGAPNTPVDDEEKRKAWRKLKLLPHDKFQSATESLANKAGHVPGEEEPCAFHAFLQEMIGR